MHEAMIGWFFSAVSHFCVALSVLGSGYALIAAVCVRRFAARQMESGRSSPGVTLLRPLCGTEPNLFEALSTFCAQTYQGPLQFVFGVHSPDDPAIAVVHGLMAAFPHLQIELVVDKHLHGANRKVSNLINMSGRIRHGIVVLADSDIVVPPDYLSQVVAALEHEGVGIVTCLYRGMPSAGLWSRLSAAQVDLHFLPGVLLALAGRLAQPCFGSTIALRRDTLAAIGGFEAIADDLADDYAVGAAVRRLGLSVVVPPLVVGHLSQETSFEELWRHEIRWARTIRLVDPIGYCGSGVTHALPLAMIGAAAGGFHAYALAAVGAALICRTLLQGRVVRLLRDDGVQPVGIPLLVLRDTLSLAVYVASFFSLRVRWRDFGYTIALGGTLVPLKEDLEP
jgi:ceramide glucosyltransferase